MIHVKDNPLFLLFFFLHITSLSSVIISNSVDVADTRVCNRIYSVCISDEIRTKKILNAQSKENKDKSAHAS